MTVTSWLLVQCNEFQKYDKKYRKTRKKLIYWWNRVIPNQLMILNTQALTSHANPTKEPGEHRKLTGEVRADPQPQMLFLFNFSHEKHIMWQLRYYLEQQKFQKINSEVTVNNFWVGHLMWGSNHAEF